jgi:endonuclease YncB( thermonuclease family)
MSLISLALAGAATFLCASPYHSDGDNMRCRGRAETVRLYGIDAPEMPGSCRPGRRCTPGNPYAARDHLRRLTRGRRVMCTVRDVDDYGRTVAECTADGRNISCAMIASGHAAPRYGRLNC